MCIGMFIGMFIAMFVDISHCCTDMVQFPIFRSIHFHIPQAPNAFQATKGAIYPISIDNLLVSS